MACEFSRTAAYEAAAPVIVDRPIAIAMIRSYGRAPPRSPSPRLGKRKRRGRRGFLGSVAAALRRVVILDRSDRTAPW
ncbi:hypothetical protein GCM10018952_33440 [Streptosporangium vulgare]